MKKKLLALFLSFAMTIGTAAVPTFATESNLAKSEKTTQATSTNGNPNFKYDGPRSTSTENKEIVVIVELKSEPVSVKTSRNTPRSFGLDNSSYERSQIISEQNDVVSSFRSKKSDSPESVAQFKSSFSSKVSRASNSEIIYRYTNIINGFSMKINSEDVSILANDERVKGVYLSNTYNLPITPKDKPSVEMVNGGNMMTGAYKGDGTIVAIIDSGIDYNHELLSTLASDKKTTIEEMELAINTSADLNAEGTPSELIKNDKVIFGYDYEDGDTDPMDVQGHGTHVAGISSANADSEGVLMSVAPNAQLMALKVFADAGGGATDGVIIAALDDALALGADVINLSLGSLAGFTSYETEGLPGFNYTGAFKRAEDAGVFVACAAGNDGAIGQGSFVNENINQSIALPYATNPEFGLVGSPSTVSPSISVASVENAQSYKGYFLTSATPNTQILFNDSNDVPFLSQIADGTYDYITIPGYGTMEDYEGLDMAGKIAVIKRGSISFAEKAYYAKENGAIAAIICNNVSGPLSMLLDPDSLPSLSVSKAQGELLTSMASGTITFSKSYKGYSVDEFSGQMSDFSSRGITPDLKIKPDITAPGGAIYSTFPASRGSYGINQGTSMAAPHVAGGGAIVKQRVENDFPGLTEIEGKKLVEQLLVATATPILQPNSNVPYPVSAQGGGLMNLKGATSAQAIVYNLKDGNAKVELGDKLSNSNISVKFKLQNLSGSAISFTASSILLNDETTTDSVSGMDFYTLLAEELGEADSINVNNASVDGSFIVNGLETVEVEAIFSIPSSTHQELLSKSKNGYFASGYVTLTPDNTTDYVLSIPFLGFVGDWSTPPAFDTLTAYDEVAKGELPFYWSNTIWGKTREDMFTWNPLGYNFEKAELTPKDYVAFSATGNGMNQVSADIYLMRNLKEIWLEIYDNSGNLVKKMDAEDPSGIGFFKTSYFEKSYYDVDEAIAIGTFLPQINLLWDGTNSSGETMPVGKYKFVVCGKLDYPNSEVQKWSTEFSIDNVSPVYSTTYDLNAAGEPIVHITVEDDNHIQYVKLSRKQLIEGEYYNMQFKNVLPEYDDDKKITFDLNIADMIAEYGSVKETIANISIKTGDYAGNFSQGFLNQYVGTPTLESVKASQTMFAPEVEAPFEITIEGSNLESKKIIATITPKGMDFYWTTTWIDGFEYGINMYSKYLKQGVNEVNFELEYWSEDKLEGYTVNGMPLEEGEYDLRVQIQGDAKSLKIIPITISSGSKILNQNLEYDLDTPTDVEYSLDFATATNVVSVKNGSQVLVNGTDYVIAENKLSIKNSYLSNVLINEGQVVNMNVTFDDANNSAIPVSVTAIKGAKIPFVINASGNYQLQLPEDVNFNLDLGKGAKKATAPFVASVENGTQKLVSGRDYSLSGTVLTLKKEYLKNVITTFNTPTVFKVTFNNNEKTSQEVIVTAPSTFIVNFELQYDDLINPPAIIGLEWGKLISAPTVNPMPDGSQLLGWYSDAELTTPWDFSKSIVTKDTTLYAKWDVVKYRYQVQYYKDSFLESNKFATVYSDLRFLPGQRITNANVLADTASGLGETWLSAKMPTKYSSVEIQSFPVIVEDSNSNIIRVLYREIYTPSSPGNSSSSNSSNTTTETPSVSVVTNGKIDVNGNSEINNIDTSKNNVNINVKESEIKNGEAYVNIPLSVLNSLNSKNKDFTLTFTTPFSLYELPANIKEYTELNSIISANNISINDVSIKVTMTQKNDEKLTGSLKNAKLIGSIVDFKIELLNTKTNKVIQELNNFAKPINRFVAVENKNMPANWGAFKFDAQTGTYLFVPHKLVTINGKTFIKISSKSNSLYVVAENDQNFTDVNSTYWASSFIKESASKGLVNGVGNGLYSPERSITRAEFVTMIVNSLQLPKATTKIANYSDVSSNQWYFEAISVARTAGLLDKFTGNNFNPNQAITREEMVGIMAATLKHEKFNKKVSSVDLSTIFKDFDNISDEYVTDLELLYKLEIINGMTTDTFAPKGETTRAQAAKVQLKLVKTLGLID